jgi:prophage regulatory protein
MRQVVALTTYSRPSIYRLIAEGRFPKPIKLGDLKIAFIEEEVLDWLNSRPRA